MRSNTILAIFSALVLTGVNAAIVTGTLGDAVNITGNPDDVEYGARLPESKPSDVKGIITGTAGLEGKGTAFVVLLSNLPASEGPFSYHIHVNPVNSTGNCLSTGGHLDPFLRGDAPPCDASAPQTCQVGDLSGKYGKATSDHFEVAFTDRFTSTAAGTSESFFGNRSFVVHNSSGARIACASFRLLNATTNGTAGVNPGSEDPPISGGARSAIASAAGMLGAVAVAAMML